MPAAAPIVLLDTTAGIAAGAAGPAVTGLGRYDGLFVGFNVSAVPAGGAPTLDVYLQATPDGGVTWRDVAAYRFTTAAGKRMVQLNQRAPGATASLAPSDAALTNDTVVPGPFGDQLRVKYAFAAGGSTGGYTLAVSAAPPAASERAPGSRTEGRRGVRRPSSFRVGAMADNTTLNSGSGGDTFRTLEAADGIKWPVGVTAFAATLGSPDVLDIVTPATGLPVQQQTSATWAVSLTSVPLATGAATAAAQQAGNDLLTAIDAKLPDLAGGAMPVTATSPLPVALPTGAATEATTAAIVTGIGAPNDAAAGSDTGTFSLLALVKRGLQALATLLGRVPVLVGGRVPVDGSGVTQPVSGPLTNAQLRAADVPVAQHLSVRRARSWSATAAGASP